MDRKPTLLRRTRDGWRRLRLASRLRRAARRLSRPGRSPPYPLGDLAALFEQASDAIFIADLEGRYTEVNAAGCRMLGYAREELIRKTIMELIPPGDLPRLADDKARFLLGEVGVAEWSLKRKDGSWLPVEVSAKILPDGRWLGLARDISDRKRLQEALRQSEADLRRAQTVAGIGSWRLDIPRGELTWSEETYRIFGLPPGSPLDYKAFLALVHPEDRASVEAAWGAALRGEPYDIEHRIVAGGETRWVHERAELEFDREGRALAGIGTVQDITDRKRAELEFRLLGERERFRAALEAAASATVVVGRDGRIAFVNRAAERLFGWTREELTGRAVEELLPERFRKLHVAQREGFFRELDPRRPMGAGRDLVALRKDLSEVPIEAGLTRVSERVCEFPAEVGLTRVTEGGQEFVVVTLTDISRRKAAEEALRQSEERFRLLVQGTREYAIFMHDPDGRITVWNEGAERILGWSAAEILGRSFRTFYTPEDVAARVPERDLEEAVEKGSLETETWRERKDGSRFWAGVLITPIRDPAGRLLGYGKVIRDLTERKKAEKELKESEARLSLSVLELEGFAYTVSHDLRSPLRAMQGYSHCASRRLAGRADPESLEMLERIGQAAERLDRLIRDLLSYSALAREGADFEAVELDDALAHVTANYPELGKARLRVRSPLGRVKAQPSLMIQVLSNLLANAVKFVPKGTTPEIDVWTERREGGKLVVFVQDNGLGVPREAWESIFKPFVRLQAAGAYEGTGIGLAIVKRAVERMGGRVGVESETGKGSRFWVELQEA